MPKGTTEGANRTPSWSDTGYLTGDPAHDCAQCHGFPPAAIAAHTGRGPGDCHLCHNSVNAAGDGFTVSGRALHINGIVDPVSDNCSDCHSSAGGPAPGTTPDTYHAKHVRSAFVGSLSGGDYGSTGKGWYAYSNTGGIPDMGCGYCHPQSASGHMNGSIELNISNSDTGAAGTLKAKNASTPTLSQNPRVSVTCSSVYCHSNGYDAGSGYTYRTTPDWYGGAFAGDRCSACHGNSPNDGTPGSVAHYNRIIRSDGVTRSRGHFVGIHYDNIYNGSTGLAAAGSTGTGSHGNPDTSTTLNCQTCHNDTVASSANDSNTVCMTCHDGVTALTKGNAAIRAGSTTHINGQPDVVFDPVSVRSKAQLRDSSQQLVSGTWDRAISGVAYKNAGAFDQAVSALNTGAQFNSNSKTCTVSCHNDNTVMWGASGVSCSSCHTGL